MKPDLYTKAVLTVIAACLVVLTVLQLRLPAAEAQQSGAQNVNVASIGGKTVKVTQKGVIVWDDAVVGHIGHPSNDIPFVLRNQ